ncbi:MAG TPA: hypothetical protein EYP31_04590 [Roseibacterium sp.]|nr:hypothetical protein [Roseibacterium sp.]
MNMSDLTLLSKIAIGLAIAGFFVSFTTTYTSSVNGVVDCGFTDYGKLVIGGLAVVIGGIGEVAALRMGVAALRMGAARRVNLMASGCASMVGIFHILIGIGMIGGPC